jgi:hypothetical protein
LIAKKRKIEEIYLLMLKKKKRGRKLTLWRYQWQTLFVKTISLACNFFMSKTFPFKIQPAANMPCVGIFAMHIQGIQKQNAVQKKNVGANIGVK